MTHPNPGKDTREQARALILDWAHKHGLDAGNVMADEVAPDFIAQIAAALSRARREGIEEAAGMEWTSVTPTLPGWYLYRLPDQPLRLLDFTQRDIEKGFVPGGDYLWYGPIPDAGSLSRRAAKEVDRG